MLTNSLREKAACTHRPEGALVRFVARVRIRKDPIVLARLTPEQGYTRTDDQNGTWYSFSCAVPQNDCAAREDQSSRYNKGYTSKAELTPHEIRSGG
jgi:hypothetical protein